MALIPRLRLLKSIKPNVRKPCGCRGLLPAVFILPAYQTCPPHTLKPKNLESEGAEDMKKQWIAIGVLGVVLAVLIIAFGIYGGNSQIGFEQVPEKEMPRQLEAEIIPQYRDTERALACRVDDVVYVLAMRGEKPSSGYDVRITDLELVTEKQQTKLIVCADFADPAKPENMARVKSYPVSVVKAEMSGLPDKIELKSRYPKE